MDETNQKNKAKGKYAAQRKYQEKVGWISKSYKLKKETVQAFADACDRAGVSQASQLTKMMLEFANQVNNDENN